MAIVEEKVKPERAEARNRVGANGVLVAVCDRRRRSSMPRSPGLIVYSLHPLIINALVFRLRPRLRPLLPSP